MGIGIPHMYTGRDGQGGLSTMGLSTKVVLLCREYLVSYVMWVG